MIVQHPLINASRARIAVSAAGWTWKVVFDPIEEAGPFLLSASLEGYPNYVLRLNDVLFGDVWLCVGQNKLHYSINRVCFTITLFLFFKMYLLHSFLWVSGVYGSLVASLPLICFQLEDDKLPPLHIGYQSHLILFVYTIL